MTAPGDPVHPPSVRGPRAGIWLVISLVVAALAGAAFMLVDSKPRAPREPEAARTGAVADTAITNDGVVAYYFHTTYRCPSCRKIEAYSRLAIESGFAGDIASGRLQFRPVNIDAPGHSHYVNDYKLYTKALVLSERVAGREVRWENLARVWELLNDESAFVDYVQRETRAFLAEAP